MIVLIATITAKKGSEKVLLEKLKTMIPPVRNEEGTISYTLNVSEAESNKFMVYEKYKNKEAVDFHMNTPYLKDLFNTTADLLDGEPILDFYTEIDSI